MRSFLAIYGLEFLLLTVASCFIWLGIKIKIKLIKHLLFNISAVIIALMLYELTITLIKKSESAITYSNKYVYHKQELGYGVHDSLFSVRAAKRWVKTGEKIYDVNYSFSKGIRVTPNSDTLSQKYGIFLGGSFTFGEGINDNETFPFYFNEHANEKLNIRNYGFHGYGTHQVYNIMKNQVIKDSALLKAEKVDVFYWFIYAHIPRVNGYSDWDQSGPNYTLNNNKIEHTGSFRQKKKNRNLIIRAFNILMENSAIFKRHLKTRWATGEKEIDLFLALIKDTDLLLKERGFKFTILIHEESKFKGLFKNHYKAIDKKIKFFLKENNIQYLNVNEMVPKNGVNVKPLIIPGDGHPTGEFNKRLAAYLWRKITNK